MADVTVETDEIGGAVYTVPACGFTAPTGMQFWKWEWTEGGKEYYPSDKAEFFDEESVTLKAVWRTATTTNTVSFDANGHGTAPAAQTVNSGETATEPTAPTESGWTFGGWYTEAACTNKFDFSTAITGDITLYAKWTEESVTPPVPTTYTVTFETNGGSAVASQTVNSGEKATKPADPTKTGFVFNGWYADATFSVAFDFDAAITADVTVYAKWKDETPTPVTYTVTFDANGHGTAPTAQIVNSGEMATEPAAPTESGWTFGGWYTEAACTTKFDFSTAITGDITLYAKWKEEAAPGEIVYTVVSGGNSTWTKGSSSGVTIVVKRNVDDDTCFSLFTSVQIGSTTLVSGTDDTAVAGSTVITLKPAALEKLSTGTKTVTINFDDGKATTNLTIKAGTSGPGTGTSPKTGDDSNPGLWITVMVLSGFGLGGLALTEKKRRLTSKH